MRWMESCLVVLLCVEAAGCGNEASAGVDAGRDAAVLDAPMLTPGCEVPVESGGYTLHIVPLRHARGAFPFDLSADGSFVGAMPLSYDHCEGTLTATERENLTAAVNTARLFCRGDTMCPMEADNTYFDATIRTTDLTRENRMCHVQCFAMRDEEMEAFIVAAMAPLSRVYVAGGCTPGTDTSPPSTDRCAER